jgi:hypothetical protein
MPFKNIFCRWLDRLQKIYSTFLTMVYLIYKVTIGITGRLQSIYSQTTYRLPTFPPQNFWMGQEDKGLGWHPKHWSCLIGVHRTI